MLIPPKTARLLFAGGGTGGHLYPAVAIADRISELLKDKSKVEIIFVGTKRGLEYRLKDNLGYPLKLINMRGLVRSFTLKNLLVPFVIIGALVKASALLKQFSPDIVIGTGGYVAWPVLKMAMVTAIATIASIARAAPGFTSFRRP